MTSKPPRKEWRVDHNFESMTVYADEVKLTPTGDLVFYTYLEAGFQQGEVAYEAQISLALRPHKWDSITQIRNGNPLWAQTGKIETPKELLQA